MRELIGFLPENMAITPAGRRHLLLMRKAQAIIYLRAYLAITNVPGDKLDELVELCMEEVEALIEDYDPYRAEEEFEE